MIKQAQTLHIVVGLGKTGLSCVQYLCSRNIPCWVIDSRTEPPGLQQLRQEFAQVPVYLGDWHVDKLTQADVIVLSPGVDPRLPEFAALSARGIPLIGDIELFMQAVSAPVIGITGSNAKGTVTLALGEGLRAAGLSVAIGGNIGTPVLDLLQQPTPDYYVLELSSFQLQSTPSLTLALGVILNISPDHLDRHGTMQNYIAAKQRVYQCAKRWVINRDDGQARPQQFSNRPTLSYGLDEPGAGEFGIRHQHGKAYLAYGAKTLLACEDLQLKGQHNWSNMLAVLALAQCLEVPLAPIIDYMSHYTGLPYRCQFIAQINGVAWYNDSKATNVGACHAALIGLGPTLPGKILLIAGGQAKGASFEELQQPVREYVRELIVFGEDAAFLEQALKNCTKVVAVDTLAQAVAYAHRHAVANETVLLSPACASFDMFANYEQRGATFTQMVQELTT